jgi:hypothetical protein
MRVLFLDVDGVLNTPQTAGAWSRLGWPQALEPALVARAKELADAADAVVVLSSTWRISSAGLAGTVLALEQRGWPDARSRLQHATPCLPGKGRGAEIQAWLAEHADAADVVVVLDDDREDMGAMLCRLVQTDYELGLQPEQVAQALAMFGVEAVVC